MTDHKKCREYFSRLSELLDGELETDFAEVMETHLEKCPECRACWASFKKSVEIYKNLDEVPLPENFAAMLKKTIQGYLENQDEAGQPS